MSDIIIKVLVFYCCILFVWLVSVLLMINEGWKRHGFFQSYEQAQETIREMIVSKHWTSRLCMTITPIAFFYYSIPVVLYERFVKGNRYATLNDPRGKYPPVNSGSR